MREKKPFISVVMPVYNVEKHLKKAVDSVRNQTFQDFEIILVDDCSPDGCPTLCEELAALDERIRVIHHERNQGLSMARNTGMEYAGGEYIWFMDSDDYVEDTLFEEVRKSLDKNPAEIVVFGLTEDYYDEKDRLHHSETICPARKEFQDQKEVRNHIIELEKQTLYGYAWNKMYKLSYLKEINLRFEVVTLIEDILFNVKYCMDIRRMNILDFCGYHYNKRMDNSLTSKFVPEYYKLHRKRIELIYRQYQYWGLCNKHVKGILGALYTRYIFSAIQRNYDERAGMSYKDRKNWIRHLVKEPLVKELIPSAVSDGKLLKIMIMVLKTGNIYGIMILGRVIYICKSKLPMVFAVLKQKR